MGAKRRLKLAVLRARTDRDLLAGMNRDLDFGLRLVAGGAANGESLDRAENAYNEAARLLPKVHRIGEEPWDDVQIKFKELGNALENRGSAGPAAA
jgi:hypothetical protein